MREYIIILLTEEGVQTILSDLFPFQNALFLGGSQLASKSLMDKVYNIFRFEPLLNLHLGIFKLQKKCTFKYRVLDRVMKKLRVVRRQRQPLSRVRLSNKSGVISLHAEIERGAGIPGLHVDFSNNGISRQLNILVLNSSVRLIIVGKEYRAAYMRFPIIGASFDRAARIQNDANMTGVHCMYPDMMSEVMSQKLGRRWSVAELKTLRRDVCAI